MRRSDSLSTDAESGCLDLIGCVFGGWILAKVPKDTVLRFLLIFCSSSSSPESNSWSIERDSDAARGGFELLVGEDPPWLFWGLLELNSTTLLISLNSSIDGEELRLLRDVEGMARFVV